MRVSAKFEVHARLGNGLDLDRYMIEEYRWLLRIVSRDTGDSTGNIL